MPNDNNIVNDDNFDVNLIKNADIPEDIEEPDQEQDISVRIWGNCKSGYAEIVDRIKKWYGKLDRTDKIAITIIIIILLLGSGIIFNNISTAIKIAQIQHRARPENPTIRKIKDVVLMPVRGLLYYYSFIGSGGDIDNYGGSRPSAPAPTRGKIYVPH